MFLIAGPKPPGKSKQAYTINLKDDLHMKTLGDYYQMLVSDHTIHVPPPKAGKDGKEVAVNRDKSITLHIHIYPVQPDEVRSTYMSFHTRLQTNNVYLIIG